MDKLTISIFGNQIFLEIMNEIKLFSKFRLKYYDNIDLCTKDAVNHDQLVIFFITEENKQYYTKIENNIFPLIVVANTSIPKHILSSDIVEQLNMPFSVLSLEKKNCFSFSKI